VTLRKRKRHRRPQYEPQEDIPQQTLHSSKSDLTVLKENPNVAYVSDTGEWIKARSENQRKYLDVIRSSDLTICIGPAGTGKTFLPVAIALQALKNGDISKIVITRPVVEAGEHLGFLPGSLEEKVNPYLVPIFDAIDIMMGPNMAEELMKKKMLEVAPIAFMRGRTLEDCFIIIDEAQNTTIDQMEMLLTRLGQNSKMVITGDITQVDLVKKNQSGLSVLKEILAPVEKVKFFYFNEEDVVRHPLVKEIVKAYEAWKIAKQQTKR
jgi:phosphate starvation-inducible PhoH-like protein